MKKSITLLACILLTMGFLQAQRLAVGNPHEEWWYHNQGTIEDAEISIHPQGLYIEIGMYLTFSGQGNSYSDQDTIEVECNFNLPEGSIVHDSWLWYNEDTLVADLIDRWTATSIYNAIVGRRQDPSILYKTWGNSYELRIYPMKGDSTRRVKLAYLVPLTFTSNSVFAELPMNIIKLSRYYVEDLKFYVQTDETWKNPRIMEYPELTFEDELSLDFNTNKLLEINSGSYNYPFTLQFDSPMKNGIFVNHANEEEDYYELAILPSAFVNNIDSKHVLVCVDHVSDDYMNAEELLDHLKYSLKNGLSPVDSFNIIFSSLTNQPEFDSWVSVNDIEDAFAGIGTSQINSYSYLPELLYSAVELLNESAEQTEIFLLSNDDSHGDPEQANAFIEELMVEMNGNTIPIHCGDYCWYSYNWYWAGSNYYRGNDYLYINLSRLTDANYDRFEYWNENVSLFFLDYVQTAGGLITSFDIHTSMSNGFCYSRFDLSTNNGFMYINKPFLQIGKYYGDFPLTIEIAGLYNNVPFLESYTVEIEDVSETDSLIEEAWAGTYIESLEGQASWYSNEIVREIIDYSIQERVLSVYTAFLALEPGALDSLDIEIVDNGGEIVVSVEEPIAEVVKTEINSYPNPFVDALTFDIQIMQGLRDEKIEIEIYDISGRKVFTDAIKLNLSDENISYQWNGSDSNGNDLPKGSYIVFFHSKSFKHVVKIMKM